MSVPVSQSPLASSVAGVQQSAIRRVLEQQRQRFVDLHPAAVSHAARAADHWLDGVPMHWMKDWGTPVPLVVQEARGATLTDVDGLQYADFCLGDTGAMFGHSPAPVVAAIRRQAERGLTCMLPGADAEAVGQLFAHHFGLPCWQITQTATDANRAVLRWARALTRRSVVLVFDGCYHGSLEDTLVVLDHGVAAARPGLVGQVADFARHARVVEFNDVAALEAALAPGDVACVLAEPVMTNAGMVLPQPGFLQRLRELTLQHGTLLAIDETHTLSSGLGGHARRIGLQPDFLVAGKAIAGGIPCAVYGFSDPLRTAMSRYLADKQPGHSGMGTTLSANALAMAALRACLGEVMTPAAYAYMLQLAEVLSAGLRRAIGAHRLPWSVSSVGARVEFVFAAQPPRTARASLAAADASLERAVHLTLLNRGVLITPFHNMMLLSPSTTHEQVELLLAAFDDCLQDLSRE